MACFTVLLIVILTTVSKVTSLHCTVAIYTTCLIARHCWRVIGKYIFPQNYLIRRLGTLVATGEQRRALPYPGSSHVPFVLFNKGSSFLISNTVINSTKLFKLYLKCLLNMYIKLHYENFLNGAPPPFI